MYLWSIVAPQKWSALAPDFAEVEENIEYVEREDEFDIIPDEEIHKRMQKEEDEDIDVLTIEPIKKGPEGGDFRMPVLYDMVESESEDEFVAIGAGQYRRRSPGQGKEWMMDDEASSAVGSDDQQTPRRSTTSNARGAKRRRNDT